MHMTSTEYLRINYRLFSSLKVHFNLSMMCVVCAVRYMMQRSHVITYFQNGENLLRWTNPFAPTHNVKFHAWKTKSLRAAKKFSSVIGPSLYCVAITIHAWTFIDQCVMHMWKSQVHFPWFLLVLLDNLRFSIA